MLILPDTSDNPLYVLTVMFSMLIVFMDYVVPMRDNATKNGFSRERKKQLFACKKLFFNVRFSGKL